MKYTMIIIGDGWYVSRYPNWVRKKEILIEVHRHSIWSSDPNGFTIYSDSAPELLNLDATFKEALRREKMMFQS